ncbi:MAG: XRE family transcriptional regulator [Chloroflexota bacterium]|nr:XRE family transcriptional regulator [Chloroflexota bacterium]
MRSIKVDVEPAVLVWAREAAGFTTEQAAKKLRVSEVTLRLWEAGAYSESQPTYAMLCKMATLYKYPLCAFYYSEPPQDVEKNPQLEVPDFRSKLSHADRSWSPSLRESYRWVSLQREVSIEIAEALDEIPDPISLRIDPSAGPEHAGKLIRKLLDVGIADQLGWRTDYQALRSWTAAVERHGILVAQARDVSVAEMRGYSISTQPFPAIVLNGADYVLARVFTLVHELTHLLLHEGGICDLQETAPIEDFCNAVAGAVLLPADAMYSELAELHVDSVIVWPDELISRLARRYWVSRPVLLRRMVSLHRATLDQYFAKLHQYSRQYERNRSTEPSEGGNYYATKLTDLGRRYTARVIDAYGQRVINAADVSQYLDAKIESVPGLARLLTLDL